MSLGVVVLVGNCPRGSCPMGVMVLQGSCPQGNCPQGGCPRGSCPRTIPTHWPRKNPGDYGRGFNWQQLHAT